MGLSGSTVHSTTTNCSRQLSASSVVEYQLLGALTAPLSVQSPNTSFKSDSTMNLQYHSP